MSSFLDYPVRMYVGVPPLSAFGSSRSSPLVVDVTTGIIYYVKTTSGSDVVTATAGGGGFANPMTTVGDIIVGGVAGAPARLGATTNAFVLTLVAGTPAWAAPPSASVGVTTLTYASGGTTTVNVSPFFDFRLVCTGATTKLGAVTGAASGQHIFFRINWSAAGSLTFDPSYHFPLSDQMPSNRPAGANDSISCQYDATDGFWECTYKRNFTGYCYLGPTWTSNTMPSEKWTAIAWGGGNFVAVPQSNGVTCVGALSANGVTWTATGAIPVTSGFGLTNIAYGNSLFVALTTATTDVVSSPTGATWSLGTGNPNISKATSLWFGGGVFVYPRASTAFVDVSASGSGFTSHAVPVVMNCGCYSNGLHIVIANGGTQVYTCSNSTFAPWETRGNTTNLGGSSKIAGDNQGALVALSISNVASVSYSLDDGLIWYPSGTVPTGVWEDVLFVQGVFLIVSSTGQVAVSYDRGANWTAATSQLNTIASQKWWIASDQAGNYAAIQATAAVSTVGASGAC